MANALTKPLPKKVSYWVLGILVLLLVVGFAASSETKSGNATPTTVATTTTAAPPVTYKSVVIMPNKSGSGQASLAAFTIPANANGWNLGWAYNCAAFGSSGNFIVTVNGLGNTQTTDAGVNQLGNSGSSVESYYDTGTFQLVVNSECNWGLKVTASVPS